MPPRTPKKAVSCPKCGSSQEEAPGVISTFCRACGHHYELGDKPVAGIRTRAIAWGKRLGPLIARLKPLARFALRHGEPWLLRYEPQIDQLREYYHRWRPPEFKRVRCHECGRIHEVPYVASSTSCPNCQAHIDLYDVLVEKRISRAVRTRGTLTIKKFGYLNNQVTICGAADIGGGAAGKIFCDGETKIRTTGRLNCEVGSRRIRIEKGADVVVAHPMRAHDMVVRGKITARIYCNGTLRILNRGFLRGEVHARSIMVDKGGLLQAELNIGCFDELDPETLGTLQERACYMALEDVILEEKQASLEI